MLDDAIMGLLMTMGLKTIFRCSGRYFDEKTKAFSVIIRSTKSKKLRRLQSTQKWKHLTST
jgi:hypothetical protein